MRDKRRSAWCRMVLLWLVTIAVLLAGSTTVGQDMPSGRSTGRAAVNAHLAQLDQRGADDQSQMGAAQHAYDKARGQQGKRGWRRFDRHIEQFRILKLLELLDLQEDQELDFIAIFRTMRRQAGKFHAERMELVDSLAQGLRTRSISDREIDRLISEIRELSDRESRARGLFLTEASSMLTSSQLGRLVVFQEKFEMELLEAVRGFRDRDRGHWESPGGGQDSSDM